MWKPIPGLPHKCVNFFQDDTDDTRCYRCYNCYTETNDPLPETKQWLTASPAAMDFPAVDYSAVFENVVMRMLGGGHARMVCQNTNSIADVQFFEDR